MMAPDPIDLKVEDSTLRVLVNGPDEFDLYDESVGEYGDIVGLGLTFAELACRLAEGVA